MAVDKYLINYYIFFVRIASNPSILIIFERGLVNDTWLSFFPFSEKFFCFFLKHFMY